MPRSLPATVVSVAVVLLSGCANGTGSAAQPTVTVTATATTTTTVTATVAPHTRPNCASTPTHPSPTAGGHTPTDHRPRTRAHRVDCAHLNLPRPAH